MAKSLIIVESPTKARTITKYLGRGYTVMASVGHVKDLPTSKLGVDLEHDFEPQYVTIKGKSKVLADIKKKAEEADKVFLAPDPDREGEAIAWHIEQELLGKSKKKKKDGKIFRVRFNEITESAIKRALQSPTEIDMKLVNAQQARRVLDRIVGYQGSQLLWSKVRRGLSMGRVQSVAMRLICEREAEREAFRTEEYWSLTALLAGANPPSFEAKLHSINGEEASIENSEQARHVVDAIQGKAFVVQSVERREKKRNPVAPFITSRLQQEASRKLHFSPKKTMTLAQQLYEGIEIGAEGATGLITYMRTDSPRISNEAMAEARELIQSRFGVEYLPATPNVYKTQKAAQEAHEAVRPTSAARDPESIRQYLDHDQYNLYKLIWNRFIASQMVPAILDVTRIDSTPVGTKDKYVFRSTGTIVKFPGHTAVYMEGVDKELPSQKPKADQEAEDDNERLLPPLSEGEQLRLVEQEGQAVMGLTSKQHFTQPPPRYNEALLIKELEEKGIGRPSTYAAIISTIQDRKYVEKTEGRLVPTETGKTVHDYLMKGFPELINVDFTSHLEEQLDEVEEGNKPWVTAVRDFYTPFTKELERAKTIPGPKDTVEPPTDIPCEKCGKMLEIKWGRNGKFLACPGYKDDPPCKNTQNFEKLEDGTIKIVPKLEITTDQKCDKCASPMVVKTGRFGKFIACSAYPQCKTTKPLALGVKCPQPDCGGDLVQKRTKKGRSFFACSNYPKCEYALWDRPVPKTCPTCQAPFLIEKVSKQAGRSVQCRNDDCGYREAG
ncbi:MAG: type I DNA topoisomerase [Nitrospiraceae bacterium]|jgi:DNA topoisomerase-1|uniref:type I DNA topoisomerase n=1 Tax=Nitrospira cf. moscoviensis SBR1015 TaxID=96242 RepID=UPI000A0CA1AD|nr:type I DNA topoisomerase [Nitrospira cf. moscoviensis SBR1015]MBY0247261.1 type I DNA topoisomerase [Nitrospiraceae bacterium]OQW36691.1 MAG: DNA topoisomerase I [Nitrospira sp. SG-bin2]